jgi:hypothetical protein
MRNVHVHVHVRCHALHRRPQRSPRCPCVLRAAPFNAQAIVATGRLLKGAPSHLGALHLRGLAYQYLGDNDLAKRHFGVCGCV